MATPFFVLGIGGTGMRCIESLIHLCAMGMFDDTEINLLALDTDVNNGNFHRLKRVKDKYQKIKGINESQHTALRNTFFSAKINYFEFSPDYQHKGTFAQVFNYNNTQYANKIEADLADLVFSEDVEQFNLLHGYRTQTHLGSMMMYHAIMEAAQSPLINDLKVFLAKLIAATQSGTNPRVFILGSVFGGTGASSIPIIPKALSDAAAIINQGGANILANSYFGSTLLTSYFTFPTPTPADILSQKIVASSDRFALNSQVAMMFYDDDTTVKSTYQKFYMLGTEGMEWNPMATRPYTRTLTGGKEQENDSHYIELMAACAALDFYNESNQTLLENKTNINTDYVCKIVDDKFTFQDFVGTKRAKEFCKKFGMLLVFALFCNGTDDFAEKVRNGDQVEIQEFRDMDVLQVQALKKYFELFLCKIEKDGSLTEGWLQQLHRSAGGEDKFLFNARMFSAKDKKTLMKIHWNDALYQDKGIGKGHKYKYGVLGVIGGSKFDSFKNVFIAERDKNQIWGQITNKGEQFYKIMFDTLSSLYKF